MKRDMDKNRGLRPRLALGLLCGSLVLATLPSSPAARAADPPASASPASAPAAEAPSVGLPPVLDRNHHLGPGDTVNIMVEGQPDYSRTVTLFIDGTFDYPVVGTIQAAGLTTRELATLLTMRFNSELLRPLVQVSLKEVYVPPKAPEPVKVNPKITALGAVARKGVIDLPEPRMLRFVLADIGPSPTADLSNIRIRYPDGTARTADFSNFAIAGTSKDDFLIKGGEEIILLERPAALRPDPIRINILGAGINKRGPVTVDTNISILEALDHAGGPNPGADLEKVVVQGPAHKETVLVNVDKIQFGDLSANYLVQPGDTIIVNSLPLKVLLVGEVPKPGNVNVREDSTLMATLLAYGGAGQAGDIGNTQIIRRLPNGKVERKNYDVRDIEKQRKPDPKLMAGDVVFVPNKKQTKNIMYYLNSVLTPFWLLRTVSP